MYGGFKVQFVSKLATEVPLDCDFKCSNFQIGSKFVGKVPLDVYLAENWLPAMPHQTFIQSITSVVRALYLTSLAAV